MKAKNSTKFNTKKKAMLAALEKTLGVVTSACNEAQIERTTHYHWLKTDPEYSASVADIENIAIDFAESKLYSSIKNNDITATIFYLKTKGKKRGYTERQEIDLNNNIVNQSTPEEAARFLKEFMNECREQ